MSMSDERKAYLEGNHKDTQRGLSIRYTYTSKMVNTGHDTITGTSIDVWKPLFCVTRVAQKTYTYVGLSKAEAMELAALKTSKYTRISKGWRYGESQIEYTNTMYCGAECVAVHDAGCLWHVDVNVNERDDIWTFTLPSDLTSLFNYINCDYDE